MRQVLDDKLLRAQIAEDEQLKPLNDQVPLSTTQRGIELRVIMADLALRGGALR